MVYSPLRLDFLIGNHHSQVASGLGRKGPAGVFRNEAIRETVRLKRNLVLVLWLLLPILTSCDDSDDGPLFELAWDQTACADPWGTGQGNSNAATEEALLEYLNAEGIEIVNIVFTQDSALDSSCFACNCGTGQRIIVTANEEYVSNLLNLGFYLK